MSFSSSLSGLSANQTKLDVIGNNLANINTIAFKASRVDFADLVSQSVGGTSANPMQVGLGVTVGLISPNFRQGGIENTGVPTNVAIQGNGFFVINDPTQRSYTRAGDFSFNAAGALVTADGRPVLGFTTADPVTGEIVTTGQPADIVVPPGVLRPPLATTQFGSVSNLNGAGVVGDTFTASAQIFDSLGTAHVATVTYTNTAAGKWDFSITVPGEDVAGGTVGTPKVIQSGSVEFDANGVLAKVGVGAAAASAPVTDVVITGPTWADGATATDITWALLDNNGAPKLTGYTAPSATSSVTQNGAPAGTVNAIAIDGMGQIIATFGAGQTVTLGQLAIATFNNPEGLVKSGANRYAESISAGSPNVGVAGTGGRGSLIGSSLEQSNVDMAQEFTQMILAQRGYQANSKSITTADQLLVETLNLKQ